MNRTRFYEGLIETDGGKNLYGVLTHSRSQNLEALWVDKSAGCLLIKCGLTVIEVTSADARGLAWQLLAKAEELDRPIGE